MRWIARRHLRQSLIARSPQSGTVNSSLPWHSARRTPAFDLTWVCLAQTFEVRLQCLGVTGMRYRGRIAALGVASALVMAALPAEASTLLKFYTGITPTNPAYTGPYSDPGSIYDQTQSLGTTCPNGTLSCTSDVLGDPLPFPTATPPVSATANGPNDAILAWDDTSPNYGGIGVGTGSPSDADQIAGTDVLTLVFESMFG